MITSSTCGCQNTYNTLSFVIYDYVSILIKIFEWRVILSYMYDNLADCVFCHYAKGELKVNVVLLEKSKSESIIINPCCNKKADDSKGTSKLVWQ